MMGPHKTPFLHNFCETVTRLIILTLLILSSLSPAWAGQWWYLIVPPYVNQKKDGSLYTNANLSEWVEIPFESLKECESNREIFIKSRRDASEEAKQEWHKASRDKSSPDYQERLKDRAEIWERAKEYVKKSYFARCIAPDDPRLKP